MLFSGLLVTPLKVLNLPSRRLPAQINKEQRKTPEQCPWRRSGDSIVNFEHISQLALVFLLLTLIM